MDACFDHTGRAVDSREVFLPLGHCLGVHTPQSGSDAQGCHARMTVRRGRSTPKQFEGLLKATYKLDADARYKSAKVGEHLRAIFLVQRWTGLRVGDVLALPKSALQGNRLTALIQKKLKRKPAAARIECVLPDHVVTALNSLPARAKSTRTTSFGRGRAHSSSTLTSGSAKLTGSMTICPSRMRPGSPLKFRSHMLRDTFAVEMLLAGVPLEKVSKLLVP